MGERVRVEGKRANVVDGAVAAGAVDGVVGNDDAPEVVGGAKSIAGEVDGGSTLGEITSRGEGRVVLGVRGHV